MKLILNIILLTTISFQVSAREQSCANGALKITASNTGRSFNAVISDRNFISELKRRLATKIEAKCSGLCNESNIRVTPKLPFNTKISIMNGEEVVMITSLNYSYSTKSTNSGVTSRTGVYQSGQYLSELQERDAGMDIFVNGSEMLGSHTLAQYLTQHW
jgi:hypothetical protein